MKPITLKLPLLALLPAALLAFRSRRWTWSALLAGITLLWALPVGWLRIVAGAHFLTDVLFGAGTALLFVPLSIRLGDALPNNSIVGAMAQPAGMNERFREVLLTAELLHAEALGVGIATIAAGTDAFFMCHGSTSSVWMSNDQ